MNRTINIDKYCDDLKKYIWMYKKLAKVNSRKFPFCKS